MKRLAILLPWFSFFAREKYVPGYICLVLQITIVGWPIAAVWALLTQLAQGATTRERNMFSFSKPAMISFTQDVA
jgi:hypothetical protein